MVILPVIVIVSREPNYTGLALVSYRVLRLGEDSRDTTQ